MARKKAEAVAGIHVNAKTLRALAFQWLRYDHGCHMVSMERSPFSSRNCPDVLGLNKTRMLVEVEIKCDKADFDKDMRKKHRQKLMAELERFRPHATNFLYYLVPAKLVSHVLENAPEYAGVLTINTVELDSFTGFPKLDVIRKALRLHDTRLSIKHCVVMARDMAGTMASLLRDDVKRNVRHRNLEDKFEALGGVLPKLKRKSKTKKIEVEKPKKVSKVETVKPKKKKVKIEVVTPKKKKVKK